MYEAPVTVTASGSNLDSPLGPKTNRSGIASCQIRFPPIPSLTTAMFGGHLQNDRQDSPATGDWRRLWTIAIRN